jgi:hypothetical protein
MAQEPTKPSYNKRLAMFIRFLAESGNVNTAAASSGFADTSTVYYHKRNNKEFAADWADAMDRFGDVLEAEAARRALKGVTKDIYYKGGVCGQEQVFSDGLMAKLLEGAKPDKYKTKGADTNTNINVKVGIAVIPMQATNVEDWERDSVVLADRDNAIDAQFTELNPPPKQIESTVSHAMKVVRV